MNLEEVYSTAIHCTNYDEFKAQIDYRMIVASPTVESTANYVLIQVDKTHNKFKCKLDKK
jgi:hypothetical protein